MIEKEKSDCIDSISTSLTQTASWRLNNAEKYSADKRYERAAKLLAKLAVETRSLSFEQWELLEPHFESPQWHAALRQTSRQLGFAVKKMSLGFFLRAFVRALEEPATVA